MSDTPTLAEVSAPYPALGLLARRCGVRHGDGIDYRRVARWYDGPALAAWLEERGARIHWTHPLTRTIFAWRAGRNAKEQTVERVLRECGMTLADLPDHLQLPDQPGTYYHWDEDERKRRAEAARAYLEARASGEPGAVRRVCIQQGVTRRTLSRWGTWLLAGDLD
jgi:hypothetical protein